MPTDDELVAALRELLIELGIAMSAAGDSVDAIDSSLRAIIAAYGREHIELAVLPTSLMVSTGHGTATQIEIGIPQRTRLRFDQVAELYTLVRAALSRVDLAQRGAREAARDLPHAADVPVAGPDAGPCRAHGRPRPPPAADRRRRRRRLRPRAAGRAGEAASTGDARARVPGRRRVRRLGHRVRHAATGSDRQPGAHPHPTLGHVPAGCGVDHRHRRAGGRADGVRRQPTRQRPRAVAPPRLRHPRGQCPLRPLRRGARRQPRQPARIVGAMGRRRRVRPRQLLAPVRAGALAPVDVGHHARRLRRPSGRCRPVRRGCSADSSAPSR